MNTPDLMIQALVRRCCDLIPAGGLFQFVLVFLIVLVLPSCKQPDVPSYETVVPGAPPLATEPLPLDVLPKGASILRYFAMDKVAGRKPMMLPLDDSKLLAGLPNARFVDGQIGIPCGEAPVVLTWQVDVDASEYNYLELRMKTSEGVQARLRWRSAVNPGRFQQEDAVAIIVSDGNFHNYRFELGAPHIEGWIGRIREIELIPTDTPAELSVQAVTLRYEAPKGPRRVTIGDVTHEALFGSQGPWQVVVPRAARLRVACGLSPWAWGIPDFDGVTFTICATGVSGRCIPGAAVEIGPKSHVGRDAWVDVDLDLGRWAGKELSLAFDVAGHGTAAGDCAWWSRPVIMSAAPDLDAVPVLMISCDTVRARNVSCYGYERQTTPHLDALARDAVVFEQAITQEAWTLPAHITMLTGLHPRHHGVDLGASLAEEVITLPELLGDAGYATAGFVGFRWLLLPWQGLSHGFDHYDVPVTSSRDAFTVLRRACAWLDECPLDRVFLFFHVYDAHARLAEDERSLAYGPKDERFLHFARQLAAPRAIVDAPGVRFDESYLQAVNRGDVKMSAEVNAYFQALYDDAIRSVDAAVGELLATVKGRGLYERAVIIVTADHGEEFGEHGCHGHMQAYEECVHVPLIVKFPGRAFAGVRYPHLVQLTDLMPTVLHAVGLPQPEGLDGQSLLKLLEGAKPNRFGYSRRIHMETVRTHEWKLIVNKSKDTMELYNLLTDPLEQRDRFAESPPALQPLLAEWRRFYDVATGGWHVGIHGDGSEWRFDIEVRTDDRIAEPQFLSETGKVDRHGEVTLDRPRDAFSFSVASTLAYDELFIRTVTAGAHVLLTLRSESPFAIRKADGSISETKWACLLLRPDDWDVGRPTSVAEVSSRPFVTVWHQALAHGAAPALPLSPEAVEELRAFGYLK